MIENIERAKLSVCALKCVSGSCAIEQHASEINNVDDKANKTKSRSQSKSHKTVKQKP